MSVLWTSADTVEATGGRTTTAWQANGVSIDTRTIASGDLFVALKDIRDGHDFVAQALEKGAAAALVSYVPDDVPDDAPLLIVDDVLQGLEALGRFARSRIDGKVIGVTGSVGKTGTKEMLRMALSGQGNVHAAEKSYNNHWGVPLTLARMPRDTDYAVIEIGMNHPGEITPLARMADLDVAIITTVAAVHLEAFSGVDEIAHAKAEIFDGLKPNGTAVLNADLDTFKILNQAAEKATSNIVTFGALVGADFRLTGAFVSDTATKVVFDLMGQKVEFALSSPGAHFAMNALAVVAACDAVVSDLRGCIRDLGEWKTPEGRGARETIRIKDGIEIELLDDSFNANPVSMGAGLDILAQLQSKGQKVAILGDMLELGETEHSLHAGLAEHAAFRSVDEVHLVGPLMKSLFDVLPEDKRGLWIHQAEEELFAPIIECLGAGDTVMVKGSKGSKVSKIVDALRKMST